MRSGIILLLLYSQSLIAQHKTHNCDQIGKQYSYSFKMNGISYSDIAKLYSNDKIAKRLPFFESSSIKYLQLSFECSLRKTIIFCDENIRIDAYQVLDPIFLDSGSTLEVDFKTMGAEITKPFFVNWASSGKILFIQPDSTISYPSLNLIRDIVSRFQFIRVDGEKYEWQIEEENTIGSYMAGYAVIDTAGDIMKYKKINSGYKHVSVDRVNQEYDPEMNSSFEFDDSSQLKKINSSEALVTTIKGDTISVNATRFFLDLRFVENISDKFRMDLDRLKNTYLYKKEFGIGSGLSQEEISRMAFTNTLGTDNFESLAGFLKSSPQFTASESEALRLKFRALAYLHPQYCEQIGLLLKKQSYPSSAFTILSEALGHTGSSYSTNALISVIRARKYDAEVVIFLLPFLTNSSQPSDSSIDVIRSIAFDDYPHAIVASTAQLILAAMANSLSEFDTMTSRKLVSYIKNKLRNVSDTLQQIYLMANTGSQVFMKDMENIILDENISLRYRIKTIEVINSIRSENTVMFLKKISVGHDQELADAARKALNKMQ